MGYGDYHSGLYRDYYRDPFPNALLSTRQIMKSMESFWVAGIWSTMLEYSLGDLFLKGHIMTYKSRQSNAMQHG